MNRKIMPMIMIALASVFVLASCTQYKDQTMMGQRMRQSQPQQFSALDRSIVGLSVAQISQVVELRHQSVFQMSATPVVKTINGIPIRMYGYNGQIPGPRLVVKQGSTIYVNFTNGIDMNTTVHWHGIRLESRFDGVAGVSQDPIKPGESFLYKLTFPDAGIYWYHPHIREDLQQELGLYGSILVEPQNQESSSKVDKEAFLMLDDIKLRGNDVELFNLNSATFTMMGRFGNVMLVNGETSYSLTVKKGENVRFYFTDVANVRPFNVKVEGYKLRKIGSDGGLYETEEMADSIILNPGERAVADVLFDKTGKFEIVHETPFGKYVLGEIIVYEDRQDPITAREETILAQDAKISLDLAAYETKAPDYQFSLEIDQSVMMGMRGGLGAPIEWEEAGHDAMMNSMSSVHDVRWIIKDDKTGKENMEINYNVRQGELKKVRFKNSADSMHPMQHPMHLHGQRFIVLAIDGELVENHVWKDTVMVPAGSNVDILVEFSNPGEWMMHCHIAEHLEAGMMTMFTVV